MYIQATLFYGGGTAEAKRIFTVSNREDGIWRIFKVVITDGVDGPGDAPPDADWYELTQGDFNGDGIDERIFVAPASVTPQDHFADEYLRENAIVVSRIRIEQAGAHGPWNMLVVDSVAMMADKELGRFISGAAPDGPAAFLLALYPGSGSFINLLPLKADGTAYTQMVGLNWSYDAGAYRIVGPHGAP
jgi:hypothetical protein